MRASPEHRRQVFETLKGYQIDNVGCGASVETLATRSKLSIETVEACVQVLTEVGVIEHDAVGVYSLKIPAPGVLPSGCVSQPPALRPANTTIVDPDRPSGTRTSETGSATSSRRSRQMSRTG